MFPDATLEMKPLEHALLYGILDLGYTEEKDLEMKAGALIQGGVDLLQLRAKGHQADEVLEFGRRILPLCRDAGVPFIVNDHARVAIELQADGLHIGQDDGEYDEVRRSIGPDMLLGRSTHSPEQAHQALEDGFDYIGFGPLFPTPTKKGRPGIGVSDVAAVEREIGSKIPVFCIGGIKRSNLGEVLSRGAGRVVIVSDLLTAPDVAAATREARQSLKALS